MDGAITEFYKTIVIGEYLYRCLYSRMNAHIFIIVVRFFFPNTPGTAGGPGGRDRTLAVKSRKNVRKITFFSLKNKIYPQKIFFFLHISSSYTKILGEQLFRTWEIPRNGSKAKDGGGKKEERKKERLNDGNNNGQATHGARKHAWRMQAAWANLDKQEEENLSGCLTVEINPITIKA